MILREHICELLITHTHKKKICNLILENDVYLKSVSTVPTLHYNTKIMQ